VLTPVNESQTMVDWIVCLELPALVVARTGLGTINHTLLTLAALRTRGVRIAGVLMVGQRNADNRAAIEQYGQVPVVGEMPVLAPMNPGALAAWSLVNLDRDSLLQEFMQ
jgi:malonyl-CoA O-methyltransferase